MARKSTKTTKPEVVEREETQSRNSSLFDYLRFGESYTSLILGIIVVIISTILLLSFVNNRNNKDDAPQLLSTRDIALPSTPITTATPATERVEPTNTPAPTKAPVVTRVVTQKVSPTVAPTKKIEPTKAPAPTKVVAQATPTPVKAAMGSANPVSKEYTVAAGDNLWTIAEKQYKSGYNWVDIARANNLSNPGMIAAGQKLKLPRAEQKIATVGTDNQVSGTVSPPVGPKITGDTYKIVEGDNLWNIAVRAYGDGYQWSKIASTNNLPNPNLIYPGTNLKIPRGK